MTVKVVTDSTADLPQEVVDELEITVVPLTVLFGQDAYKDGVEITRDALPPSIQLPRSSTRPR